MIKETSLSQVRLMEFFQVMTSIKAFLEKENTETLKLAAIKTEFDTHLATLEASLKPLSKSTITQELVQADELRDGYFVGLYGHCRAYLKFPDQSKQKAATALVANIEKYGKNVQYKPLQEESGILTNLINDFESSPYTEYLTEIGASPYLKELKVVNSQFIALYDKRIAERGEVEVGKTKTARSAVDASFKKLVKTINSLAYLNGEEPYQNLANNINEAIRKAKQ